MKRILAVLFVVGLLVSLLVPMAASAQGGLTYESAWQVQNLEDQAGSLVISFYDENGDIIPAATINDTIAANGSNNYFAIKNLALPTPFQGSAVIASDRELRVIHNLMAHNAQGVLFGASSGGYTHGSTLVNLPLVMRNNNGYNTWFSVQNAGDSDTEVTVEFKAGPAGNNYTAPTVTIKPGGAVIFDQADPGMSVLGTKFVGAVKITSDPEPVVATLVEVSPTDLMAYDGFGMGTELVAQIGYAKFVGPIFHYDNPVRDEYWSGVQVQNVGTDPTTVTLEFVPQDAFSGVYCTETQTIQPWSSATFGVLSFAGHPAAPPNTCYANNQRNKFVGSVAVLSNSANQPLNAIVNQTNQTRRKAASYSAFMEEEATRCVGLPLIMDRNYGYDTNVTIYNANTVTVTLDITYTAEKPEKAIYNRTDTYTIAPKTSKVIVNGGNIGPGFVGSAKACGRNSSDKLLAIVNEIRHAEYGDSFYVYNGFNLQEP